MVFFFGIEKTQLIHHYSGGPAYFRLVTAYIHSVHSDGLTIWFRGELKIVSETISIHVLKYKLYLTYIIKKKNMVVNKKVIGIY